MTTAAHTVSGPLLMVAAHYPRWSAGEWASVTSAFFAAVAAVAASLSARVSVVLQRASRVPDVSGAVTVNTTSGRVGLVFANAGPVLAVQVMYLVVGGKLKHGSTVASGHLAVGQEWKLALPDEWVGIRQTYLVWGWRDLDNNVYFRSDQWKTTRISRRRYLRREDTTLGAMFREMYPDVAIP